MTKRKIYFRADASATIGYGHFVRTLALADMLKDVFECTFFTSSPSVYQIGEMEKVCSFVTLNEDTKFEDFLNLLAGDEIVVLDNYFFTTQYMQQIKDKGCKLVCVDDMHNRHYPSDVVINHGLTDPKLFDVEPYTKLALGLDYALLRKPFLTHNNINKEYGHWFVSFGGTDYDNMTAKFVGFLESDPTVKSITVVIGDAYKHHESLYAFHKIEVKKNLTASQMQQVMSRAEYAILPCSTVCVEALYCGCKIASGFFVDNQREGHDAFAKQHIIYPLGNLYTISDGSFIDHMKGHKYTKKTDGCMVPSRYIKVFNEISLSKWI